MAPTPDSSGPVPPDPSPQGVSLEPPALLPAGGLSWALCLYRQAGEATAWLLTPPAGCSALGLAEREPRPSEEIEAESAARAKGRLRRFARANRLNHLWTLTNREAIYDYGEMARRVERFQERAREDGYDLPLAIIPEAHPRGHGWHLHAGADRFLPISRVRKWWPYGHVHVRGPRPGRATPWRSRKLAAYLSKYISKSIGADELHGCAPRPARAHRYWITQGYEPQPVSLRFRDLASLMAWLRRWYGQPDAVCAFGQADAYRPEGYWFSFPDRCLGPPPRAS